MGTHNPVVVGYDIGDKLSEVCVLDQAGAVLDRQRTFPELRR